VRAADAALLVVDLAGDPLQDLECIDERLDRVKIRLVREADPARPPTVSQVRTLMACNKFDAPEGPETFETLQELLGERFPMVAVSALDRTGLEELRRAVFCLARVIRIYAKEPGKPPDLQLPFTVKAGTTLLEFARHVHKDFLNVKLARLWGPSAKFEGIAIQKDHVLQDGDIVELHL